MLISFIQEKIRTAHQAKQIIQCWKILNDKIIFTNGCFDILHEGHVTYLAQARAKGSRLIVGLNSDASIKRIKGENRPIQNEKSRALILATLLVVDTVVIFDEDTPLELIKACKPDVLVKGGDYKIDEIVGHDFVTSYGGEVITLPYVDGHSTTSIIENVNKKS
ncbi:MAG: D-glycero-beta-D-manno-heptose 1-phosphate adenylyltransferase [Saprospiraceae bacterium]|nr:D-glycero-beta-D-manno-heptose 1-phosphate adenylyltransferase [Saprospiraceae bacterium]